MPRADVALGALLASVWMAMAFVSRGKAASKTETSTSVEPIQLANAMRYAAPIVLTNLAYLALFFGLRAFVAADAGLARSGQFSLALELGLKLVMTLGTALDLYLFQLAVRARDQHGEAAGLAELERNARLIFALLAPTVLGLWLVLPSLETLLVAPAYCGAFGSDLTGLLPALLLYASIQYIFHPAFQLSTRTSMIGAASALVVVVAAIGWGAGRFMGFGAVPVAAGALSCGLAVGLSWLAHGAHLGAAFRWPHLARLALALAGLAMVVLPLRQGWAPGLLNLVASAALGAAAFTIIAFIVNLGDIRSQWRVFRKPGGG
jgi:O-antigen/teichoic acid export membrane protein